jgi:hypothetical protein
MKRGPSFRDIVGGVDQWNEGRGLEKSVVGRRCNWDGDGLGFAHLPHLAGEIEEGLTALFAGCHHA